MPESAWVIFFADPESVLAPLLPNAFDAFSAPLPAGRANVLPPSKRTWSPGSRLSALTLPTERNAACGEVPLAASLPAAAT
jgi:hypothetical protein